MQNSNTIRKIALIGSYVPRQCGIATFTKSLRDSLVRTRSKEDIEVIALVDGNNSYSFPAEVAFEICQQDRDDYFRAAEYLNSSACDVICVQHEYGIYGGPSGEYLLDLLDNVSKPIFATFHTVLETPSDDQRRVLVKVASLATKVVVMSERAVKMLQEIYGISSDKISMIHHGVPDALDREPSFLRRSTTSKKLLTFGLLSPDKGIEHVIRALPQILKEQRNINYLIVGATHPHVKADCGEAYRESLEELAASLGVLENVTFINRFVSSCELVEILEEADIYITPYLKQEQITSGTLAYAVGSGKAVISTAYWYAEELLAEDRGVLVPWRDSDAIALSVTRLLTDDSWRETITRNAKSLGKQMSWSAIGRQYFDLFHTQPEVKQTETLRLRIQSELAQPVIPLMNFKHLSRLTDSTGLIQHAIYSTPRYSEGYCLDDNCRALLLVAMAPKTDGQGEHEISELANRYLSFVAYAFEPDSNKFRNFMSYSREWLETEGSEDSQGRALWCLGGYAARTSDAPGASCAIELFKNAIPSVLDWTSPRAWAFALIGIGEFLHSAPYEPEFEDYARQLSQRLTTAIQVTSQPGWSWYESYLTYCNAVIPHSLLVASRITEDESLATIGLETLEWLWNIQVDENGLFEPIGSTRAFLRGEKRPQFDQQPVEVSTMISACIEAWKITREEKWRERANQAFSWFEGMNWLGQTMIDTETGACFDGLQQFSINQNQGAESTVSFLMSCAEMRVLNNVKSSHLELRQVG